MTERDGFDCPPSYYYDNPWLPSEQERREWRSLVLYPDEAQDIILNTIAQGETLSEEDIKALQKIRDGTKPLDFFQL